MSHTLKTVKKTKPNIIVLTSLLIINRYDTIWNAKKLVELDLVKSIQWKPKENQWIKMKTYNSVNSSKTTSSLFIHLDKRLHQLLVTIQMGKINQMCFFSIYGHII